MIKKMQIKYKNQYLLIRVSSSGEVLLISLASLSLYLNKTKLFEAWGDGEVISQPLLLPVRIESDPKTILFLMRGIER